MVENHISALPVIDHTGRCVGILSTSDFVDMTYNMDEGLNEFEPQGEIWWELFVSRVSERVGQQSVLDLMAEEIAFAAPDEPLVHAARKMLRERIHHLPVLDAEQRLVGILTMTDILRAFVQSAPRQA
jgi:CBS domain-containing membrane protein